MADVQLTAYNVKTKEKGVPIMDAVITKTAKGAYMVQGHDGKGNKLTVVNALLEVSYELKQNIYLELTFQQRNSKVALTPGSISSTFISGGVRINMFKRQYDY